MILFVGRIGSDTAERACFQEIDDRQMFGPVAKWVAQIDRTDRSPEFVARAFAARESRPALIELRYDVDYITPEGRLSAIIQGALARAAE